MLASAPAGDAWITYPHNPTGLLWSQASIEPLLELLVSRYQVVVRDCRLFAGLGDHRLRIGLQRPLGNR